MPRLFLNYTQEILALQSYSNRQQSVQDIVSTVTPSQALTISHYGRLAPTLPPGLIRSLSQAGLEPDHPVAQFAITQQQYRNMMSRGSWNGEPTRRRTSSAYTYEELQQISLSRAIAIAEEAGIVQDGILVEPSDHKASGYEKGDKQSLAFNKLRLAFERSSRDFTYIDRDGRPVRYFGSKTPEERSQTGHQEHLDSPQDIRSSGGFSFGTAAGQAISRKLSDVTNISRTDPSPQLDALRAAGLSLDPNDPLSPLKPIVQPAFMLFDAPVQELQGQIRNVYAATHGYSPDWFEPQSNLGTLLTGDFSPTDAGDGYFVDPESALARERRSREAERGQIGGHNVTLGRWVASSVSEPDTTPFRIMSGLVDASVQLADPTAFSMGKVGKIGVARRLFQPEDAKAGIFQGYRNFFHGPTAQRFLDNNPRLIDTLTSLTDPYDVAKLTNFNLSPDLTRSLANASDPADIRGIISGAVERGRIRSTTDLTGTYTTRILNSWADATRTLNPQHTPRALRILKPLPSSTIDLDNPQQVATNLTRVLHNAHAPEEDIRAVYNQVANSTTRTGLYNSVLDAQGRVGNMLRHYGIQDDSIINDLIQINRETYNEHLSGLYDDIGRDMPTWEQVLSNGDSIHVAGPHLPSEYLSRFTHIPNIREVRRLTTRYSFLTAKKAEDVIGQPRLPLALIDSMTSKVLKPLWLMRLAWPVRVIGEEQIRMATAGLDSAFSGHPLSWVSFVVGSKQSRLNTLLETLPGIKAQSTLTLSGLLFDELDDFQKGVYNTHRAWLDRNGSIPLPHRTLFNKTIPAELSDFRHSWADELSTLYHDPVSNYVANHTLDESVTWLWKGKGRQWRQELQQAHPGNLTTRSDVQTYVETVSDRIHRMTGGDTGLLDVVRTGTYLHPSGKVSITKGATQELNSDFTRFLDNFIDIAPTKIRGNIWTRRNLRSQFGSAWDHTLDRVYGFLMGVPTAKLSRAPTFKQSYWNRVAELIPYADPQVQQQVLANATKSTLPNRTLRRIQHAAQTRSGKLSIGEMEDLAKGYALDDTKSLLYDISEKGQASDILRNIIPFAEAWREVLTRWSSLTVRRAGKPIRRAQQIIQGARGEELGELLGAPEDKGFFYKNEFGEEVFAYPGSQWMMSHETNIPFSPFNLPGIPVPLTGRVQGLNMFGSILPSLGPVALIPAAFFLQDKPQYDWWRKQLLPFGGPGAEDASTITDLQQYLPAYMRKGLDFFFEGGRDDRVYNSSVMYVASYLYSTGKYSNSIEDQQRLMEDARTKARDVYAIRALGQFILPAAPSPSWLVKDKDGTLLSQRILAQEFYDILDNSIDYQEATETFLERYGTEAIGAIIPHSSSIIPNVPTSIEAATWVAQHPTIKKQFPLTYALFAPEGGFDLTTYTRNFYTNERDALSPEQWQALRDNTLANYWYEFHKRQLGPDADSPTEAQARWLRQKRSDIQEHFPYWGDNTGRAKKPEIDVLIRELYRAIENPTIANTESGKALILYLKLRDQAVSQSISWSETDNPHSFRTAQGLSDTRRWLRFNAENLIAQYPQFRTIWDYVLEREFQVED